MADIELVIKIPEELYRAYKDRPPMLGDAGMDMIAQAIANGTPIPDNATNGDILKLIFPDGVKTSIAYTRDVSKEWINTPYQKGDKA